MMNGLLKDKQTELYQQLARLGEALSSPHRLKIVSLLSQGAKTVDQLAGLIGQSKATTSAHLKVLENSGMMLKRKQGRYVWCRLANRKTLQFWLDLRSLGQDLLPESREIVQTHFSDKDSVSDLDPATLSQRLATESLTLLDLRPLDEFEAGHLPTARHLPYAKLSEQLSQLVGDTPLLVYCRGPYCLQALKGTETLREKGLPAQRLTFGAPEWFAEGLSLEAEIEV
ncbi:metalloregulator ArsR/SmtB family transcription factor [Coraliomargarita sp. SDUM461003]|uniref:Metalloregulator ArsR/SmtB family transcription factor n=1 Tax=Thalassobacterium maritimum TaxID=3041265 RepID=A0ABU1AZQ3_9BACT|nr:metalloregulator ArsR/SmtB family transcription factor [Coraliomargarita sp. SDUM461003]MDQ8209621.1 metalloregulator ArsR/SmtB family transcription factor [Coraliomargarita sp. SDUM461003]